MGKKYKKLVFAIQRQILNYNPLPLRHFYNGKEDCWGDCNFRRKQFLTRFLKKIEQINGKKEKKKESDIFLTIYKLKVKMFYQK